MENPLGISILWESAFLKHTQQKALGPHISHTFQVPSTHGSPVHVHLLNIVGHLSAFSDTGTHSSTWHV